MKIAYEAENEGLTTEDLAPAFNTLVALVLKNVLVEDAEIDEEKAEGLAEDLTFALATMFDHDGIVVSGKVFSPRVAFVDGDKLLPGAADFDFLHEYAALPFDDLDDLEVSDT